jgi:thiol-disulfide isomerase/thioredoxin
MSGFKVAIVAVFAFLFLAPAVLAVDTPAGSTVRSKEEIMADLKAVTIPQPDQQKFHDDQTYQASFIKEYTAAREQRAKFAREFINSYPDDPQTHDLLPQVWASGDEDPKQISAEVDQFIAKCTNPKNIGYAKYVRTALTVRGTRDPQARLAAVNQFIADVPDMKEEGASMLLSISQQLPAKDQTTLIQRVLDEYPGTQAAQRAVGMQKLAQAEGKPFELEFTDAISGNKVSTKEMKGKVIVVDFWATWCGPCVGEMPRMKELYAKYKDKGVEFIGVSLDEPEAQGGLKALKDFVAKNDIGWPQYYQGKAWQSEFSMSWGINSIPHMFVVNQDGIIVTVEGRSQLETLIPKLLAKQS